MSPQGMETGPDLIFVVDRLKCEQIPFGSMGELDLAFKDFSTQGEPGVFVNSPDFDHHDLIDLSLRWGYIDHLARNIQIEKTKRGSCRNKVIAPGIAAAHWNPAMLLHGFKNSLLVLIQADIQNIPGKFVPVALVSQKKYSLKDHV